MDLNYPRGDLFGGDGGAALRRGDLPAAETGRTVLEVNSLTVSVGGLEVVRGVSFAIGGGERVGLIGESGSGKTMTALAIMGLLPDGFSGSGQVMFRGRDLLKLSERELCDIRGDRVAMVFQEPMTALNPVMKIGDQVAEQVRLHRKLPRREASVNALTALERVHLPDAAEKMHAYAHQLSGGQRQRAMLAMATSCSPELLIADEPTTALDVTVQAQILRLLKERIEQDGSSLLLITHDLPVVANICQRVLVLYDGHIVEEGSVEEVFDAPRHPYTRTLLDATLSFDREPRRGKGKRVMRGASSSAETRGESLFRVEHVTRRYALPRTRLFGPRKVLTAVDDVSFELGREETLGVVGESGSGKTTLMKLLLGLEKPDTGSVTYGGDSPQREVQVVFQDPASALDPRMRVRDIILEPLRVLRIPGDHERRLAELLDAVGLPLAYARRYPHEFSGGQRQRIAIARALAPRPRVLIGDEPVSSLDVSVRAQILNLLEELRGGFQLTLILVSHDLSVVRDMTDRVLVMRQGRIVEAGATREVFRAPRHAYTQLLLESIPRLRP